MSLGWPAQQATECKQLSKLRLGINIYCDSFQFHKRYLQDVGYFLWDVLRKLAKSEHRSWSGLMTRTHSLIWSLERIKACWVMDGPVKVNDVLRRVQAILPQRAPYQLWSKLYTSSDQTTIFKFLKRHIDRSEGVQASGFFYQQVLNIWHFSEGSDITAGARSTACAGQVGHHFTEALQITGGPLAISRFSLFKL